MEHFKNMKISLKNEENLRTMSLKRILPDLIILPDVIILPGLIKKSVSILLITKSKFCHG